jgi:hypothetical protein
LIIFFSFQHLAHEEVEVLEAEVVLVETEEALVETEEVDLVEIVEVAEAVEDLVTVVVVEEEDLVEIEEVDAVVEASVDAVEAEEEVAEAEVVWVEVKKFLLNPIAMLECSLPEVKKML